MFALDGVLWSIVRNSSIISSVETASRNTAGIEALSASVCLNGVLDLAPVPFIRADLLIARVCAFLVKVFFG